MRIVINTPALERIQELKERNDEILSELYANLMEINQISIKLAEKERGTQEGKDNEHNFKKRIC